MISKDKIVKLLDHTPILTMFLLEAANIGQIIRMWTEKSAEGQSILSWMSVNAALILWFSFYWHKLPFGRARTNALFATGSSIFFNVCVILSAIYFRYLVTGLIWAHLNNIKNLLF